MSLMSVNRSQRVTSQLLRSPSNSTINSSTSPRWSRYFPGDAACKCPPFVSAGSWFLIPYCAPNFCTGSFTAAHYARDFLLLNLTIISSAVSSPFFTFSTTVLNAKPSLGSESLPEQHHAAWLGETDNGNLKSCCSPILPMRCGCGKFLHG
jgi:hypothetical protein